MITSINVVTIADVESTFDLELENGNGTFRTGFLAETKLENYFYVASCFHSEGTDSVS